MGLSSAPEDESFTPEEIAAGTAVMVEEITRGLETGTLEHRLPPLGEIAKIGLGRSTGGLITIITQANHRSFDAIAGLGYSAIHTVLPGNPEVVTAETFRRGWFWEDTPEEIIDLDFGGGYPVGLISPEWGSPTVPFFARRHPSGVTRPTDRHSRRGDNRIELLAHDPNPRRGRKESRGSDGSRISRSTPSSLRDATRVIANDGSVE